MKRLLSVPLLLAVICFSAAPAAYGVPAASAVPGAHGIPAVSAAPAAAAVPAAHGVPSVHDLSTAHDAAAASGCFAGSGFIADSGFAAGSATDMDFALSAAPVISGSAARCVSSVGSAFGGDAATAWEDSAPAVSVPAVSAPAVAVPAVSVPAVSVLPRPSGAGLSAPDGDRARGILAKVTEGFRALGAYGVSFEVASDEHAVRGNYAVEGEKYYLVLGNAEVYCDGAVRYEVDNRRREVTIDVVDTESRNILNNPVRAFDFLDSEYTASLVGEQGGRAVIRLTPTPGNTSSAGNITLTVDTATLRPRSLAYDYDGEQVQVAVSAIAPLGKPLRAFSKDNYADYEFIDFR